MYSAISQFFMTKVTLIELSLLNEASKSRKSTRERPPRCRDFTQQPRPTLQNQRQLRPRATTHKEASKYAKKTRERPSKCRDHEQPRPTLQRQRRLRPRATTLQASESRKNSGKTTQRSRNHSTTSPTSTTTKATTTARYHSTSGLKYAKKYSEKTPMSRLHSTPRHPLRRQSDYDRALPLYKRS